MSEREFVEATSLEEGPNRVAALAAWVQSLVADEALKPVLVGGGAVELYTGGAYRTGDLDFVGIVGKEVAEQLEAVGFRSQGRHWVHEQQHIFFEFPGSALDEGETAAVIEVGKYSVLVIGLEELIVDRLAAWEFWSSEIDGINAFRLAEVSRSEIDWNRLHRLVRASRIEHALDALERFIARAEQHKPTMEELETWAAEALKGIR